MPRCMAFGPARLALGFALSLALLAGTAPAQKICFTAELTGAAAVPPNGSAAKGTACAILDRDANTLDYRITYDGFTTAETAAHIHGFAPPGAGAGVKHGLPPGTHKVGTWSFLESDEASIVAGLTYVNIHSGMFPGGEIRGQLVRSDADVSMLAILDGAQAVPPNGSPALGTGCVLVDTVANTLDYNITYTGLTGAETVAHIHGFAPPGAGAGVKYGLPVGFHKFGTITYPESDESGILSGLTYVNVHSTVFPGGEIRGQILPGCTNPTSYCTAGTTTNGCNAAIIGSGQPSASLATPFSILVTSVEGQKQGIVFYGLSGPTASAWGMSSSFLCVKAPTQRTGASNSGGTVGLCDGVLALDWNAYQTANPGALGNPFAAGDTIWAQGWFRDPPSPKTTHLSDGMEFVLLP